eukprot:m.317353 g.317353  ORF g.317353 m.317353 type:complete len:158 (+) comp19687_c0_seq10:946-1419(+)
MKSVLARREERKRKRQKGGSGDGNGEGTVPAAPDQQAEGNGPDQTVEDRASPVPSELSDDEPAPELLAPQLVMGPDGQLVVDESSLVQRSQAVKDPSATSGNIVVENNKRITYASFSKRAVGQRWTPDGISCPRVTPTRAAVASNKEPGGRVKRNMC